MGFNSAFKGLNKVEVYEKLALEGWLIVVWNRSLRLEMETIFLTFFIQMIITGRIWD